MKKIFSVAILFAALLVVGCTSSSFSVVSDDSEIKISAENADDSTGEGNIKIPDGAALNVDAKITAGKLLIRVGNDEHAIEKSGESFIDVPPGGCEIFFTATDGLTGEIILRPLPKV